MTEERRQYSHEEWEAIRRLALGLAHGMLSAGAETYRIEETAWRVLRAYGAENIDIFAIANYLSISFESPAGDEFFAQRRVPSRSDNLAHIIKLNDLTRRICRSTPEPETTLEEVREILKTRASDKLWTQVLITGYVGFGFALMIGAGIWGALYAFVTDVILRLCIFPLQRLQVNRLFVNIIGGFIVTILTAFTGLMGLGHLRTVITAGSFMYLFPGISLMNSIRDLISNDTIAGLSKLLETLLAALSIAIGSGLALGVERLVLR